MWYIQTKIKIAIVKTMNIRTLHKEMSYLFSFVYLPKYEFRLLCGFFQFTFQLQLWTTFNEHLFWSFRIWVSEIFSIFHLYLGISIFKQRKLDDWKYALNKKENRGENTKNTRRKWIGSEIRINLTSVVGKGE